MVSVPLGSRSLFPDLQERLPGLQPRHSDCLETPIETYSVIGTLAVSKASTISPLLDKGKAMASHGLDPCLNRKETPVAATGLRVVMTSKKSRTAMLASSGSSTS